jgi:tyrosyl-tRNA synthetase
MAGSDQYGNIVSGVELIRRSLGERGQAFGVTAPLVTRSDGRKFSKSEGTAIWLTPERTSPWAFYQYWLNVSDADAVPFLRTYTLLERPAIEELAARHAAVPQERRAQHALAEELTERLHGAEECRRAREASEALFGGGDLRALDAATLAQVVAELPRSRHPRDSLGGEGVPLLEILPGTSLCASKREARELLGRGAVRVNGEGVPASRRLGAGDLLAGGTILLRRGKKDWHATLWG